MSFKEKKDSKIKPGRLVVILLCLAMAMVLSACQTSLYSGLNEDEANTMLATLLERGIETSKVSQGKNGFSITVDKKDVVRSLEILRDNGLPRPHYESLGQVFSGQGMVSSPVEEQSRLSYALSQELAATFSKVDGVLTARAHVVLASYNQATGQATPASAAVFLRHAPDSPAINMTAKIKEICAQSVPGLSFDRVSVMLVPVRSEVVLSSVKPSDHSFWFWPGLFGGLALLAAGLFLSYRQGQKASLKESGHQVEK